MNDGATGGMRDADAICGIDEAGRGPWAGPVVAAAVVLRTPVDGLNDSKLLTARAREHLFDLLSESAMIGVGIASVEEIDSLNILRATDLAMCRALTALPAPPVRALVDGNRVPPDLVCAAEAVVGGDACVPAISAASIIAKVTRDRIMADLARAFPGYGWERNAGYGVKAHAEALRSLGVTPHHRRSFRPIHKILCEE